MINSSQIKEINIGIINLGVDFETYRVFCLELLNDKSIQGYGNLLHTLNTVSYDDFNLKSHSIARASNIVIVCSSESNNRKKLIDELKELQLVNSLSIIEIYFSNKNYYYTESGSLNNSFSISSYYKFYHDKGNFKLDKNPFFHIISLVGDDLERLCNLYWISTGEEIAEARIEACLEHGIPYLDLSNLGLTGLPDSISELSSFVEYICIGNRQYFLAAEDFGFCEERRFGYNDISDISILDGFKSLKGLYCSQNRNLDGLKMWSPNTLAQLEHLDLYNTGIFNGDVLYHLKSLKMLDISYVGIVSNTIPLAKNQFQLKDFRAEGVSLKKIDKFLNTINEENLVELNLSKCGIKDLNLLLRFKKLRCLILRENKLRSIDGLQNFTLLEKLNLSSNSLSELIELNYIPESRTLLNLSYLNLSHNNIRNIDFVSNFPKLETLDISRNSISNIDQLVGLSDLKYLNLSRNKVTKLGILEDLLELGLEIGKESFFMSVVVDSNPLVSPPMEIAETGKEKVLQYFNEVSNSLSLGLKSFKSNEVRVLVIGNAFVGKSNLAYFIRSGFIDLPPSNKATHGIDDTSFKYKLKEKDVYIRMIDFGGQDYYHDLHHIYFSSDTIYFLLWTSSLEKYEWREVKRDSCADQNELSDGFFSYPVGYWLGAIKYLQQQSAKRKEESKSLFDYDSIETLDDKLKSDVKGLERNVLLIQTKRSENDYWYYESYEHDLYKELIFGAVSIDLFLDHDLGTIIKKGIESLKENFEDLIEILTKSEWPGYYQAIVDFFKSQEYQMNAFFRLFGKKRYDLLTLQESLRIFNLILKKNSIYYELDELNALAVLDYLSNRGFVLSLPDQKYCLDPRSFSKQVYDLLPIGQRGISELPVMNSDFEKALCDLKVIAPHPIKEGRFIAPQLLPESISSEHKFLIDHIKHTYLKYELDGFIHKSFLIDIFHAFSQERVALDEKRIWKNGLVFKLKGSDKDDVFYKIEFLLKDSFVIEVSTSHAAINYDDYKFIAELIESIISSYPYSKFVKAKIGDFVEYEELSNAIKNRQVEVKGVSDIVRLGDIAPWWHEGVKLPLKRLFISYASPDRAFVKRLKTHLEPHKKRGIVDYWYDHMIEPGMKWDEEIKNQIDSSDVLLWLVSPDFLASNYVHDVEIPRSVEIVNSSQGNKRIVSLMVRPVSLAGDSQLLERQFITREILPDKKEILIIDDPNNDKDWVYAIERLFESFNKR